MKLFQSLLIWLYGSILAIALTHGSTGPKAEVINHQVYLKWDAIYYNTVLRSRISGGYYGVIAEKLEEPQYVDTPQREMTYYYVMQTDGEIPVRTEEIKVYVP